MKTLKFIIALVFLMNINAFFTQEITYQRPIDDLDFYTLNTNDKIYRVNYGVDAVQITSFSREMAFIDMTVVYLKDMKFKNSKGKKVYPTSMSELEDIFISQQYIHLIFSPATGVKAEYAIIDVKVELTSFSFEGEIDIIETIQARREVNVTDGINLKFSKMNKEDSTLFMFYKKPNNFADNLTYTYCQVKIQDEITIDNKSDVLLMAGVKRDFFYLDRVFSNANGALVVSGYKVETDKYRKSKYMYFIKDPEATDFKKMEFKLEDAEPLDFRVFIEEDDVNIIGLARTDKDKKYVNFLVRYKKGNYMYPDYAYLDKGDEKPDYEKVMSSVYKYNEMYYVVYHYRKEVISESLGTSIFSPKNYHIDGFNVEQYDVKFSLNWSTTIKSEYLIDRSGFMDFTKAGLMFYKDKLILAYNDSYENSEKSIEDKLSVLDLKMTKEDAVIILSKQEKKELSKKKGRTTSIEIEDINTEHDFTITLVTLDSGKGTPTKLKYQQRRLHSLILAQEIRETSKGKFFYPYFYGGLFGLCSINLINI